MLPARGVEFLGVRPDGWQHGGRAWLCRWHALLSVDLCGCCEESCPDWLCGNLVLGEEQQCHLHRAPDRRRSLCAAHGRADGKLQGDTVRTKAWLSLNIHTRVAETICTVSRTVALDELSSVVCPSEQGGAPTIAFRSCVQHSDTSGSTWAVDFRWDTEWKTAVKVFVCMLDWLTLVSADRDSTTTVCTCATLKKVRCIS